MKAEQVAPAGAGVAVKPGSDTHSGAAAADQVTAARFNAEAAAAVKAEQVAAAGLNAKAEAATEAKLVGVDAEAADKVSAAEVTAAPVTADSATAAGSNVQVEAAMAVKLGDVDAEATEVGAQSLRGEAEIGSAAWSMFGKGQ